MFEKLKQQISNRKIAQLFLIVVIFLLIYFSFIGLKYFFSGFLGAVTLYILFRNIYKKLIHKGWGKSRSSIFLIIVSLLTLAVPVWLLIEFMIPQMKQLLGNQQLMIDKFNQVKTFMANKPVLKNIDMSQDGLTGWLKTGVGYVPKLLGSVGSLATNIIVAFFVLYFMQINSRLFEKRVSLSIPFSKRSKKILWAEVEKMVRSNAIGIPILALCQGIVAIIGYMLFGVNNAVLWGLITGAATVIPVVGTMLIWVPVCIVLMASGQVASGLWLSLYCLIVVGGIDNVLRFTILKKLGDVPPLITVFGVILGLNFFGMMGLIFGPLMLSVIGVLLRIYSNEYGRKRELYIAIEERKKSRLKNSTAPKNEMEP